MKNLYWKLCCAAVILLSILCFTPLVIPAHEYRPLLWGLPRTLWAGMLDDSLSIEQIRYFCKQHGSIPLHNHNYHGRLYVICPDPEWREEIAGVAYEEATGRLFADGVSHHKLYLDYGVQMKARSKAVQTFVVQLACDSAIYLPTAKAIRGGHYSSNGIGNDILFIKCGTVTQGEIGIIFVKILGHII